MRVLGIDLGRSRTGLALSDPLGVTCSPLGTIEERDEGRLIAAIVATAQERGASKIVLGLPRSLRGGANPQSDLVVAFKARLEERTAVPVELWDERFTSKLAGKQRSSTSGQDAVAACYILQSYLDARVDTTEEP
jgi:putative holliday junction resolvase